MTQISPMLAVSGGHAAMDFYKAAFGAQLLGHLGSVGDVVVVLLIGLFWLNLDSKAEVDELVAQ